jgi:hypothetical protein
MVTQVDFLQNTFAKVTGGNNGLEAPEMFAASSQQVTGVLTTAGAIADMYSAGLVKAKDIIWVNGDMDGTPFQNVYTVTATSGGSLITYPNAVGGALLAANNLSDVVSAATSATNLGLGTGNNVAFLNVFAGASGAAGVLRSYPATAAKGYLALVGVANTGDTAVSITNAAHGQASVLTIPDGGQTASSFLITNSAGTQTIATGNIAMTAGYLQQSAANALTAHVGGGQGSALALARQINRVTTVASAGDSVLLPAAIAGRVVTVINAAAANAMDCFPASGEIINALSANTALSIVANKTVTFYCAVAGTWNSQVTA